MNMFTKWNINAGFHFKSRKDWTTAWFNKCFRLWSTCQTSI